MIGDDFGFKSFNKYFYELDHAEHYIFDEFEVSGFNNNKNLSYDRNVVSRMRNNLVGAIKEQPILPKFIVVVLDDDIINYFLSKIQSSHTITPDDAKPAFEKMIRWLMNQYDRLLSLQKDMLPKKAKKHETYFIWVQPPSHIHMRNAELRELFGSCLESIATAHKNTFALKLIKIWDQEDPTLYNVEDKNTLLKDIHPIGSQSIRL